MDLEPELATSSNGTSMSFVAKLVVFCPRSHLCLEPSLQHSTRGTELFIVEIEKFICPGAHFGELVYSKLTFRTDALIDRGTDQFTILNGSLSFCKGECWDMTKDDPHILQHSNFLIDEIFKLIETWYGIGAVGAGFHSNGIETICRNDSTLNTASGKLNKATFQ